MSNPEVQRNALNGSPAKPSDALLKSFRATLTKRWNEFDQATLQEAQTRVSNHFLGGFTDAKTQRDKDLNFIQAKATFDEAMSALAAIDTDAKLKQTLETPGKLGASINALKDYLAKADAQKNYNTVLSNTLADLTSLRAQVTDSAEDKKDAEQARATTLVLASTSTVLGNEAMKGLSSAVTDGSKAVQQEIVEAKKNPGKTIAQFLGFSEDNILADYREALAEKKAGGFDGMFAGLKIWFYGFMAKVTGFNIAKSLTPEELKLAGLQFPSSDRVSQETRDNIAESASIEKERTLYTASFKGLILMNTIAGVSLPNQDGKIAAINRGELANVFSHSNFAGKKYSEIESAYTSFHNKTGNWKTELLKKLGLEKSGFNPEYVLFACSLLVNNSLQSTKIVRQAVTKKSDPDIQTLMTDIHDEFHPMLAVEKVGMNLEDILKDGITGNPEKLFAPFSGMFHMNEKGQYSDEQISKKATKLGLNEENFIATMLLNGGDINMNNLSEDNISHLKDADNSTKEKLRKLSTFWLGMKGAIIENFSLGHKKEYAEFISGTNISLRTVVKFYLATNGNISDIPDMSGPRKMAIYSLIWSDVFSNNEDAEKRGKLVNQPWIEALGSWIVNPPGITDRIPENVRDVVLKSLTIGKETILNKLGKYTSEIWYSIPNEYLLGGGIVAILGLYVLFQMRYFKGLVTGLAVGTIAASIAGIIWTGIPKNRLNKNGEFILSDSTTISKDQFTKNISGTAQ